MLTQTKEYGYNIIISIDNSNENQVIYLYIIN